MIIIIIMKEKKNSGQKSFMGYCPDCIVRNEKNLCCKARFVLQLKGA